MSKFKGFVGASYQMASLPISAQRCVNWYPEKQTNEHASTYVALQATPGYKEIIDFDDGTLPFGSFNRGMYRTTKGIGTKPANEGSVIVVVGPRVIWYKPETNTYEILGEISFQTAKVDMEDDGFGLIIADGVSLWRVDLLTKQITKPNIDVKEPTHVAYMDRRTISIGQIAGLPQNTFYWSDIDDNNTWQALSYGQAGYSQDPLTGLIQLGNFLYLFGPNSFEQWTSNNDKDFPFTRSYGSSGTVGLHAVNSLCKIGNNVLMIGSTNQGSVGAYMSQGDQMVRISTLALDREWSKFDVKDCTSWVRSQYGHDFVVFNFDAMDRSWEYDVGQNEWHEVASRDESIDKLRRWEPNNTVQFSNKTLVGDRYSAKLYDLSNDYTTENGKNILRIRTTAHMNAEQKTMMIRAIRFDMDVGNGITDEDQDGRYSESPLVMFRYSTDRGKTWSTREDMEFGAVGEYETTVEFHRLGMCRNLTVEFSVSDACHTSILNGWIYPVVAPRSRRG